jgi:hypothetical protein
MTPSQHPSERTEAALSGIRSQWCCLTMNVWRSKGGLLAADEVWRDSLARRRLAKRRGPEGLVAVYLGHREVGYKRSVVLGAPVPRSRQLRRKYAIQRSTAPAACRNLVRAQRQSVAQFLKVVSSPSPANIDLWSLLAEGGIPRRHTTLLTRTTLGLVLLTRCWSTWQPPSEPLSMA